MKRQLHSYILLLNISFSLFSKVGFGTIYYAGPCPCTWSTTPYPFWTGTGGTGTRLPGQPAVGDLLIIPSACTVSINGGVTTTNVFTLQVQGNLNFPGAADNLNMASGSVIKVFTGGSITGPSASNQIKIGPGGADWSGPGTLIGPANVTTTGTVSALPIELTDFSATCIPEGVQLTWATATELNNDYFLIERSVNGVSWEQVAKIKGLTNNVITTKYAIIDNGANNNLIYYRMTQVDIGGASTVFKIIDVNCGGNNTKDKMILFPNPASSEINAVFNVKNSSSNNKISLVNTMGQVIFENTVDLVKGVNSFAFPLDIQAGSYAVSLTSNEIVIPAQKLMIEKP